MKLVIGKQIVNNVFAYASQVGLSAEEKDDFWDKKDSILISIELNGHVGRDADGYGGMSFGTRNAEGEKIL